MGWIIGVLVVVGFFYLVGRLTSKAEEPLVSVSSRETKTPHRTDQNKASEGKRQSHSFDLYGTKARLEWVEGSGLVEVWCITQFRDKKPVTQVIGEHCYDIDAKLWYKPPKGATRECLKEIKKVLKLD